MVPRKEIVYVQEKNDKFVAEKTSGQAASEREKLLKDLAAAYDVYTELTSNLSEGTKVGSCERSACIRYKYCLSSYRCNYRGG